jgi:hypothetical protein
MQATLEELGAQVSASAEDLLLGSKAIHTVIIPAHIVRPGDDGSAIDNDGDLLVRIRPLTVESLTLIAKATRNNAALVPILSLHQSLVEPTMTVEQVKSLHIGLVQFLMEAINRVSGLSIDGKLISELVNNPAIRANLLLAKHFGWTPEQVSQLTPSQVAVYLAGIERLTAMAEKELE